MTVPPVDTPLLTTSEDDGYGRTDGSNLTHRRHQVTTFQDYVQSDNSFVTSLLLGVESIE